VRSRHGLAVPAVVIALAFVAAACGSGSSSSAPTTTTVTITPPGNQPSPSSLMICATEGQTEIAATLGEKPVRPVVGTWAKPDYSCRYAYPEGSMRLSVHEAVDLAAARAFYRAQEAKVHAATSNAGLGQGTATTADGRVLVIKDNKVLEVDGRRLPAQFGHPAASRDDVALETAITVMGCWTGA
jgi:hypothetical protein